ncbi:MAG: sugar phosphate nucleotidyltransferase [Planctomycetia bacterium]|nr:sugar phosphate nucleotidyltransferase [Planctomycetia bacterium]
MRHALILAGGRGSRLWPLGRGGIAKPFLRLIGGRSLLELAYRRLDGCVEPGRRIICSGEDCRSVVQALLPELMAENWLGEPCGRDTLAAVSLGFLWIRRRDPDATIAMIPADLFMTPDDRFRETLARGFDFVESHPEFLLTFGVPPTCAATGYGWLEPGEVLADFRDMTAAGDMVESDGVVKPGRVVESGGVGESGDDRRIPERALVWRLHRFREKPSATVAEVWWKAGRYLWNSGMFLGKSETFCETLRRFEPEFYGTMDEILRMWDRGMSAEVRRLYAQLKRTSVDYAILERMTGSGGEEGTTKGRGTIEGGVAENKDGEGRRVVPGEVAVTMFPEDMRWADVGSWTSPVIGTEVDERGNVVNGMGGASWLSEVSGEIEVSSESRSNGVIGTDETNESSGGNRVDPDVVFPGATRNSFFRFASSPRRHRVRFVGVHDMIVVETDDVLLVTTRDAAQRVRELSDRRIRNRRRTGRGRGRFVDCGDCRLAVERCPQEIVILAVDGVDMVADRDTITLITAEYRSRYGSFQRLRKLGWIPVSGKNRRQDEC